MIGTFDEQKETKNMSKIVNIYFIKNYYVFTSVWVYAYYEWTRDPMALRMATLFMDLEITVSMKYVYKTHIYILKIASEDNY